MEPHERLEHIEQELRELREQLRMPPPTNILGYKATLVLEIRGAELRIPNFLGDQLSVKPYLDVYQIADAINEHNARTF